MKATEYPSNIPAPEVIQEITIKDYSRQAWLILRFGFAALPIVAGLDKFFHILTNWEGYLAPVVVSNLGRAGLTGHNFMLIVGVVEIIAGLIVSVKPRIGAYIVAVWLAGIIINLLLASGFYDIALRDLGLCIGAVALGKLSCQFKN